MVDISELKNDNNKNMVTVLIQYKISYTKSHITRCENQFVKARYVPE